MLVFIILSAKWCQCFESDFKSIFGKIFKLALLIVNLQCVSALPTNYELTRITNQPYICNLLKFIIRRDIHFLIYYNVVKTNTKSAQ